MASTAGFFSLLLLADFLAICLQHTLPALTSLYGVRPILYPVLLAYAAQALPFALVLAFAFFSGFLWDALTLQVLSAADASGALGAAGQPSVELSLGWSIVLYAILGLLMHGLRPLFLRGRWDIHCLASGLCTVVILLSEFLLITFRRGSPVFPSALWPRIFLPGFLAMLAAPLVFFTFNWLAGFVNYPVRDE